MLKKLLEEYTLMTCVLTKFAFKLFFVDLDILYTTFSFIDIQYFTICEI